MIVPFFFVRPFFFFGVYVVFNLINEIIDGVSVNVSPVTNKATNREVKLKQTLSYANTELYINGQLCDYDPINKDKFLSVVFQRLNNSQLRQVKKQDLSLAFFRLDVETMIKGETTVKPARLNRNKTEFTAITHDRKINSTVANRKDSQTIFYGIEDTEAILNKPIKKTLWRITGYYKPTETNIKKSVLFSHLGEIYATEKNWIKRLKGIDQVRQNKTITYPITLTIDNPIRQKIAAITDRLNCDLRISAEGLVSILYADQLIPIGMIGLLKTKSYQYISLSNDGFDYAGYFNREIGTPISIVGTHVYATDKDLTVKANTLFLHLSKIFASTFWLECKDGIISCTNGKYTKPLVKCIDNGENHSIHYRPIVVGVLDQASVMLLHNQTKRLVGKHIRQYCTTDLNTANQTYNKLLVKDLSKVYTIIFTTLRGKEPEIYPIWSHLLHTLINDYGLSVVKDNILTVKKALRDSIPLSQDCYNWFIANVMVY